MCTHVLYSGYHRFFSKMKQIQTFFTLFGKILCLIHFSKRGPTPTYQNLGNDLPTYLVCRGFKTCLRTFKDPAGVTQAGHTGLKPTANPKKAWVVYTPTVQWLYWPLLLQILDKNRPKSSQNLTPILWLVLTTTHYQEQLLQSQGEFMVKKGPLESEKGPRGPEKGLLRS